MSKKTEPVEETMEALWKKLKVGYAKFEFNCGGDSMGDTDLKFYTDKGTLMKSKKLLELDEHINDIIYDQVEFYVNSDGHYMGESGHVEIRLDEDGDEPTFTFDKYATSEFSEAYTEHAEVLLTDAQVKFIKQNVSNMNGGFDSGNNINYSRNFILTEDDEDMITDLMDDLDETAANHEFEVEGEYSYEEWYTWTTGEPNDLKIKNNKLTIEVSRNFTEYRDSSL